MADASHVRLRLQARLALELLADLQAQGLVVLDEQGLKVTADGWYLVRAIAMVFDKYLQSDKDRARFSKII